MAEGRTTDCRAVAATVLGTIIGDGRSLSEQLPPAQERVAERDRALLQQLCYGTLRSFHRLDGLLQQLLRKPLKDKDADIHALLLLGLYQLLEMRTPAHAAISATVEASRSLKKPWASGLVNGVLRSCSRDSETLLRKLKPQQQQSHPRWLYQAIKKAWPEQFEQILAANNSQPPMCLRVNRQHMTRDNYLAELEQKAIVASACPWSEDGVRLAQARDVNLLPGFDQGWVSVQDEAAQLAAILLDCQPGQRVLDACAAPGGKSCHILERQPQLADLLAIDLDPERLIKVEQNLERLGLSAAIAVADARNAEAMPGSDFDRILIDAPCSGSGVIRRHPDIKLLRRRADIGNFAITQGEILDACWALLAPGGRLLYATCSILPAENQEVVAAFLARTPAAREQSLVAEWGHPCTHGRQFLPDMSGADGLYYALLEKPG